MQERISLAERLISIRKETGLSRSDFSQKIGVSAGAYKNYELALRDTPLSVIIGIHKAFGIDIHWLVTGEGAPNSEYRQNYLAVIIPAIKKFESQKGEELSSEQEIKILGYLLNAFSNGQNMNEPQIIELLKTAT